VSASLASIQSEIRAAADPAEVSRLEKLRPNRALVALWLDWSLIALAVALVASVGRPWAWVVAFALVGGGQYRLFVLGHEAIHGCLHPDRRVNDAVARWLIYGPLFVGFDDSRKGHLAHHRELGEPSDPERYIHSLENKGSRARMLWFYSGLATFSRTVQNVLPRRAFTGIRELRAFALQRLPVAVAQAVLASMLLAAGLPWWSWLALWVAPIYVFVFVADEIRTFCDHAVARVPDAAADRHRLISYWPGLLEAWFLAPHAVHFQAEHHLWPSVPYYNLAAATALTAQRSEVEKRRSYLSFLRAVWRSLPAARAR
jgi:fatty acid desaturase